MNQLNEKQREAVQLAIDGKNILLTGAAGCGKSYTISTLVAELRSRKKKVAITASTGAAALLIGGRTLHSFLGVGLAKQPAQALVDGCHAATLKKLMRLHVLVIDEVSMISAELLDKVSAYLAIIRGREIPFGGVQVILTGDLFQLPPVEGDYCFASKVWAKAEITTVQLSQIYRQHDPKFLDILGRARRGTLTDADIEVLEGCKLPLLQETIDELACEPTRLFSTNANVDRINDQEMKKLIEKGAKSRTYTAQYSDQRVKNWATSVGIRDSITLCIGAQVMLTRNLDVEKGLVNGSRGVVIGFEEEGPRIKFDHQTLVIDAIMTEPEPDTEEKRMLSTVRGYVIQIPLILAWALTINKAQGCTLDCVEMDLGPSIFAHGQAYTALSRARSLEGIRITSIAHKSFKTDPRILELFA